MQPRYQRCDVGTFLVCVDSYNDSVPTGRYSRPYYGETGHYKGLVELLMKLENSMDLEDVPQSFREMRTFYSLGGFWEEDGREFVPGTGKVATFSLQILFRRNSSWQGSITWLEGRQTQSFRSVLEMIALINSALTANRLMPLFAENNKSQLRAAK